MIYFSNNLKPSLNQIKLLQTVCNGFGFSFRNFTKNRMVWFLVWPKVAQTEPNQTSPTLSQTNVHISIAYARRPLTYLSENPNGPNRERFFNATPSFALQIPCPAIRAPSGLGMPQFGSEPKFECELFRTGLKFGPRFGWMVEPDHKSGSTFEQKENVQTWFKPNFFWISITHFLFFLVIYDFGLFSKKCTTDSDISF